MKNIFILIVGLSLFACNNKPSAVQLLDNEVMRVHDEAMAQSALVLKLKKTINNQLDSTRDLTKRVHLQKISAQLYKADRMMLEWMHQYQTPNLSNDTAINYLNIQLNKINEVHSVTFESIKTAQLVLDKQ
ncbi:MAG: hypothetical protein V4643_09935 [Bacteroidota bacterium]